MQTSKCRVCKNNLLEEPLLLFRNMPAVAQNLPDAMSLMEDRGINLEICQCSGCGLIQLNGDPVPYYKDVIRASAFSDEMRMFRLRQFSSFLDKHSLKGKKAVEIGCGKGEYLSLIQQSGASAFGVEHSTGSVQHCIQNGLSVSQGFVGSPDYIIPGSPFESFFMMNFLEHLPDPDSTLQGICNNLSKAAVGLVEVPNFDMILQKKLFSEFTRDHLFYFTKDTLNRTLELNGYETLELKSEWHDYILSASVRKREKRSFQEFESHKDKIQREITDYISRFGDNNVAIWGAGHQALAVMSIAGLSGRVKYVIDSAPFKQGKYTPATHIPIVSPEYLNSDPVRAVIIMAAAYSDEVANTLEDKFDPKIHKAVLRDSGLEIIGNDNKNFK